MERICIIVCELGPDGSGPSEPGTGVGGDCQQGQQAESGSAGFKRLAGIGKGAGTYEPKEVTEGGWKNLARVPKRLWVPKALKSTDWPGPKARHWEAGSQQSELLRNGVWEQAW